MRESCWVLRRLLWERLTFLWPRQTRLWWFCRWLAVFLWHGFHRLASPVSVCLWLSQAWLRRRKTGRHRRKHLWQPFLLLL